MTWLKISDAANEAPEMMEIAKLAAIRQDRRLINELKGATFALYTWSAQNSTDYRIPEGVAISRFGIEDAARIMADLLEVGIVTGTNSDGDYLLVEREDFFHLIKTTDKRKRTKHRADLNRGSLMVPVLLRDGDRCRYCGEDVVWKDTKSERGGTIDHRAGWEAEATPDNVVVSCRSCNSIRQDNADADKVAPLLEPPEHPAYGEFTRDRLKKWKQLTAKTCAAMGIVNPIDSAPAASRRVEPRRNLNDDPFQPGKRSRQSVSDTIRPQTSCDVDEPAPLPEARECTVPEGINTPFKTTRPRPRRGRRRK